MSALAYRTELLNPKMARLRAMRLERDAAVERERQERQAANAGTRPSEAQANRSNFFDNIDTSGGQHACHWWTGQRRWNRDRYEEGFWHDADCESFIARRVLVFKTYGKNVPADKDVSPLCDEYLCCNISHMMITPHGGKKEDRLKHAIPVEEFFCD